MSYDLFVFDPQLAPRDRVAFIQWYLDQVENWPIDCDTLDQMTGNLPRFYELLRREFPPLNGPGAYDWDRSQGLPQSKPFWRKLVGLDRGVFTVRGAAIEDRVTEYNFAKHSIYLNFGWSVSNSAWSGVFNAACSVGVGFFEASAENPPIIYDRSDFDSVPGR
ncbi:hypothetical protein FEE96_14970 [Parasedimentitalea maritima]|uniref:Uncharacterized protein n=1 Tax=Parasedimentitalea maritima TaxID=2578117 RepID=A0ABY2UTJ9_9RHOB|nr:hypothetical protein [Zongyanglinia marina]TLP61536.1 hypothetical protein FEE96_14970 [Zongyanglinia marina]